MVGKKLNVKSAATTKPGRHGDGDGLSLHVSLAGARRWVFRYTFRGKVSESALGNADVVTLSQARAKAADARKLLDAGTTPIAAKRLAERAARGKPTFGEVAEEFIAAKEGGWRNAKHRNQWASSLAIYAKSLKKRPIDEIDTAAVLAVLKPIWLAKPETANRVRNRIELVLNAAKAKGLRAGDNPATWRGHLDQMLAKRPKASSKRHFKAMPYEEVPEFMAKLREQNGMAARALEFAILTGARTGETLGAQWAEIDLVAKVWTIPKNRTKAEREHRVPLSAPALAILTALNAFKMGDCIFPSPRGDRPMAHPAMQKVLLRMNVMHATVHGFRSSFRDWAGDATLFQREVAEAALSHKVGDAAEQAYRRGDALDKRRALMTAWASHCETSATDNVLLMKRPPQTQVA